MILHANITSTTGSIEFDVNFDQSNELILNTTGLGVGTVPSSNLHIQGNAFISERLYIGQNSGEANLNIHGTLGYGIQTVSSNTTLSFSSTVLVNSSSDNITLTLPFAANVTGRIYKIKKTQSSNQVLIGGGGNTIDQSFFYELNSGNCGSIELLSNGRQWHVLNASNGVDYVPWTPEYISTSLWLDSNDTSTVLAGASDNVYQWSDKSGNDRHALQSTASDQPTTNSRTLNGLNVLDFNSEYLTTSLNINRSDIPDLSVFAVFAQDATTGNFGLFGADNGGWDRLVLLNFDNNTGAEWGASNASGTTAFEVTRTSNTNDHILTILWDSGASNGSQVALNGSSATLFTENTGSAGFTTTGIGSIRPTSQYPLNGYIAEMVFINSIVDDDTKHKLEGYLAWKWGLENNLPGDHPYKFRRP